MKVAWRRKKHEININLGRREKELRTEVNWSYKDSLSEQENLSSESCSLIRTEKVEKRDGRAQLGSSDHALRSGNRLAMCGDSGKTVQHFLCSFTKADTF